MAASTENPYANWMGDLRDVIGSKRLSQICIPATHNSGSYHLRPTAAFGDIGTNWANTQSKSMAAQLLGGIRALDLRFHYTGSEQATAPSLDDIVITHASDDAYPSVTTFAGAKAADELQAIDDFLSSHPQEIVIVFIKTRRFHEAAHMTLADEIDRRFGSRAIPSTERHASIDSLLGNTKGRIVLTHGGVPDAILRKYSYIWTSDWKNLWPQTTDLAALFQKNQEFLAEYAPKRDTSSAPLYTAGLAFTATAHEVAGEIFSRPWVAGILGIPFGIVGTTLGATLGAIFHSQGIESLKEMAQITNRLSYNWIQFLWARTINLFSVDYFEEGGDVMPLVLSINRGQFRVPLPGNAIDPGKPLRMYSQSERFIGPREEQYNGSTASTQYYPKLDQERGVLLQLVRGGTGPIRHGDEVVIQSNETGLESGGRAYNRLGAWSTPALYYYYEYPGDNETWTISKADPSDPVVHYNDLVVFRNKAYAGQVLTPQTDNTWLTTTKIDVPFFWWLREPPA